MTPSAFGLKTQASADIAQAGCLEATATVRVGANAQHNAFFPVSEFGSLTTSELRDTEERQEDSRAGCNVV